MAAIYVETMEDFLRIRPTLSPVYITSKAHGPVLVPCANTVLVRTSLVVGNGYNPNLVPAEKMNLLRESIVANGFCFPVVTIWDDDRGLFVVIDGFHRMTTGGPDWLDFDYLPVVILNHDLSQRLRATWQFNKARGVHQVDLDAELIRRLVERGDTDEQIAGALGVDVDTVYRYKQVTGVAELFAKAEYSGAWEMVDDEVAAP